MKKLFSKIKAFFKKRKKLSRCICIFLIIYLLFAVYFSVRTGTILRASSRNLGENNPYTEIISDENFKRACHRKTNRDDISPDSGIEEIDRCTPIFTIHWFTGAKSYYKYSYEFLVDGEVKEGSWGIEVIVTSGFQDGKWKISKIRHSEVGLLNEIIDHFSW